MIDPQAAPEAYLATWLGAALLIMACLGIALVDVVDVLRDQVKSERRATRQTMEELLEEARATLPDDEDEEG